jgi:acyl carrier protein
MTDEEFLTQFTEAIGADAGTVALDTPLISCGNWDSVAYLAVMTLMDERMGVVLSPDALVEAETPRAILEQARQG